MKFDTDIFNGFIKFLVQLFDWGNWVESVLLMLGLCKLHESKGLGGWFILWGHDSAFTVYQDFVVSESTHQDFDVVFVVVSARVFFCDLFAAIYRIVETTHKHFDATHILFQKTSVRSYLELSHFIIIFI